MQATSSGFFVNLFVSHHLRFFALRVWKTDTVSGLAERAAPRRGHSVGLESMCRPSLTSSAATGASCDGRRRAGGLA